MQVSEYTVAALAQLHKALGDETRLRIVHLLLHRGELCVCDVESILGISQSKASRHLSYLKHAGVVQDRRDGTWIYYRLAAGGQPGMRAVLREVKKALAGNAQAQGDLERAQARIEPAACTPIRLVADRARAQARSRGGKQ